MSSRRTFSKYVGSSRGFHRDQSGGRTSRGNEDEFGRRSSRGGRNYPAGLKGKEIGLFFARQNRKKNETAKTYVCVDQKRQEKISQLLETIDCRAAVSAGSNQEIFSKEKFEDVRNEEPPDNWWNGEGEPGPSRPVSEEKYSHIKESAFKRKFLENITANEAADRGISDAMKDAPLKDEKLDMKFKKELEEKMSTDTHYFEMVEFRKKLPSFAMKEKIIDLVNNNPVVVISGETGCGKTTQVAQFILDDGILANQGSTYRIVCTQPRRISAISVAERVADERSETCGQGSSTGYQIRLEKKLPRSRGSITFCTTGILLEWMKSDQALSSVSHLILDEIHERDVLSDFIITILKSVIPKRPDLKIILMSATLNAERFSEYYNNCPCINIPGYTYPVTEYYLEDVLQLTRFKINPGTMSEEPKGWQKHLRRNKEKIAKAQEFKRLIYPYIRQLSLDGKYSDDVLESIASPESEELNLELIAALIHEICRQPTEGAILVFLPGWAQISTLNRILMESGMFPAARYRIIPLHSMMPTVNQKEVFNRPPPGVRKIVISTSIAETSITIDDVVYVVDSGKTKMKNFDVHKNISTLESEWVSYANACQRRGRAGRVKRGVCYHLYTRARENMLMQYPLPEMLRSRLEEVILQLKMLRLGKVRPFLAKVMDPPDPRAVDLSLKLLQTLNAIDLDENLSPLGFHLARLPLDPQTGKMILLGAIFSCVDPVFSVAASLGFRDAFVIPLGKERAVDEKKHILSKGSKSDHMVLVEAMKKWEDIESKGRNRGRQFCWDHFLSPNILNLLRDMKRQFAEHLHEMKFLSSNDFKAQEANRNSDNLSLVKAIICAGLYPNVATVRKLGRNCNRIRIETPEDGRVSLHPKSVNEKEKEFESPFLVYHQKLRSTAVFLHDTTIAYPLPLLFFGEGPVKWHKDERGFGVISINETVKFRCRVDTADLVKKLRRCLDDILKDKISHPGVTDWSSSSEEGKILRAIVELITSEDKNLQIVGKCSTDDGEDHGDDCSDESE